MLLDYSAKLAMPMWQAEGRCLKGALLLSRGKLNEGTQLLRAALGELLDTGSMSRYTGFLGVLAQGLGATRQGADGIFVIDKALERNEHGEEGWCTAELLRIKGELLLMGSGPDTERSAEDYFQRAIDWARHQGALSWELRAATSLARLLRDRHRNRQARDLLTSVYDRFTEGFATADLKAARALLEI